MIIILLPWQLIDFCIAHPFGHDHHHHEGPSPCELREQLKDTDVISFLPPMECKKFAVNSDDFQIPEEDQLKPAV